MDELRCDGSACPPHLCFLHTYVAYPNTHTIRYFFHLRKAGTHLVPPVDWHGPFSTPSPTFDRWIKAGMCCRGPNDFCRSFVCCRMHVHCSGTLRTLVRLCSSLARLPKWLRVCHVISVFPGFSHSPATFLYVASNLCIHCVAVQKQMNCHHCAAIVDVCFGLQGCPCLPDQFNP